MKKIFSVLSLAALVIGVSLPVHSARAASAGDLVKCEDFSAVYYLAEDGERYIFPNEKIYFSWYPDFHDVKTISCADLATLPLGDRIVYQAGTRLVKIPSDPSVFAVENNGVLREIPDEATAVELFGEDWDARVDDVSEAFWSSFIVGEPLAEDEIPEGTILEDEDGDLFRVEDDGSATEISVILTTNQEGVLGEHALSLDDIEERLGLAIALIRVDATAAIAVLEDLIARLRTVGIEDDEAVDVGDFDEVEDEDDAVEDAQDAIDDVIEEIAEAEGDIAEDADDGKDVTASEALLVSAREHLALAQSALTAGDLALAEEHADEARHDAMWARGKAVDSIDNENEDEDSEDAEEEMDVEEDDAESNDVGDVDGGDDGTNGQDNDSSDDSDDSDSSGSSGNDSSGSGSADGDES
ncbi:MAG: hypothetical protein AAB898_01710 [Patescibacteria group bacterium]